MRELTDNQLRGLGCDRNERTLITNWQRSAQREGIVVNLKELACSEDQQKLILKWAAARKPAKVSGQSGSVYVSTPQIMTDVRHLTDEAQQLLRGWVEKGYDVSVADEMSRKMISVEAYENELEDNENDFNDLTWHQLMATLAESGKGMEDFEVRLQKLQEANDKALASALSSDSTTAILPPVGLLPLSPPPPPPPPGASGLII